MRAERYGENDRVNSQCQCGEGGSPESYIRSTVLCKYCRDGHSALKNFRTLKRVPRANQTNICSSGIFLIMALNCCRDGNADETHQMVIDNTWTRRSCLDCILPVSFFKPNDWPLPILLAFIYPILLHILGFMGKKAKMKRQTELTLFISPGIADGNENRPPHQLNSHMERRI